MKTSGWDYRSSLLKKTFQFREMRPFPLLEIKWSPVDRNTLDSFLELVWLPSVSMQFHYLYFFLIPKFLHLFSPLLLFLLSWDKVNTQAGSNSLEHSILHYNEVVVRVSVFVHVCLCKEIAECYRCLSPLGGSLKIQLRWIIPFSKGFYHHRTKHFLQIIA